MESLKAVLVSMVLGWPCRGPQIDDHHRPGQGLGGVEVQQCIHVVLSRLRSLRNASGGGVVPSDDYTETR